MSYTESSKANQQRGRQPRLSPWSLPVEERVHHVQVKRVDALHRQRRWHDPATDANWSNYTRDSINHWTALGMLAGIWLVQSCHIIKHWDRTADRWRWAAGATCRAKWSQSGQQLDYLVLAQMLEAILRHGDEWLVDTFDLAVDVALEDINVQPRLRISSQDPPPPL